MACETFNIKEWQDKFLTENDFTQIYVSNEGWLDKIEHAKKDSDYLNSGFGVGVAKLFYHNNSSGFDKSKVEKVKKWLDKAMPLLKKSKEAKSTVSRINYLINREAKYVNGMYEGWYNMWIPYLAKFSSGNLKPYEEFAKASKAKKYNSYGSKKSIAIFGK